MKGYQSPAEHAKQVALVKAVAKPEHDMRTEAILRMTDHIGRGSYTG